MATSMKFDKMTSEAAINASRALSKLCEEPVAVELVQSQAVTLQDHTAFDGESLVAGIYVPIQGDMLGSSLLTFPEETAHELCAILSKSDTPAKHVFSEFDQSALKEVGNIICGSFLTIFSNTLGRNFIGQIPIYSFGTYADIITALERGLIANEVGSLIIEVKFGFEKTKIIGNIVLLFGMDEMKIIEDVLSNSN